MSRDQRRLDRKSQARSGGTATPSRRTPVKAPGSSRVPWVPLAVVGGTAAVFLLIGYLIFQAASGSESVSADRRAELDDSPSLPGDYYPPQGRGHFSHSFVPGGPVTPFCEGVPRSAQADEISAELTPEPTREPSATPDSESTPAEQATPTPRTDCYNSNPPSSGQHLSVFANVSLGDGVILPRIPADPDVYPRDIDMPRESIPHILEHAGVFVGYHCADGDAACEDVIDELEDLVNSRIDNNDDRVVMARSTDLPVGEIGLAGWTRAMNFKYEDYDPAEVRRFIGTHSCRFDPEGFC